MNKQRLKNGLRKLGKGLLYTFYLCFAVLLLFELAYRYQWIDFYSTELNALNKSELENKDDDRTTVLIFGDSFTADPNGYIKLLREEHPEWRIINAAIPGTGIREARLIAEDRIEQFKPSLILYQIYEGNDLIDIERPRNWSELSFTRNVYWWISDYFLGLRYVNYKAAQLSNAAASDVTDDGLSKLDTVFSAEAYSPRQQLYIKARPSVLQDSRYPKSDFQTLANTLLSGIQDISSYAGDTVPIIAFSVPHAGFTHQEYQSNMALLGAQFEHTASDTSLTEYLVHHNLHQNKIAFIDLTTALSSTTPYHYYYANDPHLNRIGQRQLATTLHNILQSHPISR